MVGLGRKRLLVLVLIILVPATILFFFLGTRGAENISFINLVVVPSGSSAKLDGKGVKSGTLKVMPGYHTITVSRKGFTAQEKNLSLEPNETRFVGIALISNSPESQSWYKDHPEDQRILESISSRSFDQYSSDIAKKMPLVNDLPLIDRLFRIDYGQSQKYPDNPTAIAIYITYYSKTGRQQAIHWIKFKGYDLSKLEIVYENAAND